jgi:hypothetical protein
MILINLETYVQINLHGYGSILLHVKLHTPVLLTARPKFWKIYFGEKKSNLPCLFYTLPQQNLTKSPSKSQSR